VKSLASDNHNASLVSIQLATSRSYYLRHAGSLIRLNEETGSNTFKKDSTFELIKNTDDSFRLKSFNYPNRYICLRGDGDLWIAANPEESISTFIFQ